MLKKIALPAALLLVAFALPMLTTRSSRFVIENAAEFGLPADAVWEAFATVPDWPAWWPGVRAARLSPGCREGAVLELVLEGNPERSSARIVTFVPGKEIAWSRKGVLGSTTRTRWRLQPGEGGTVIRLESPIEGPQAVLARVTGREAFEKYHQTVLASLQRRLLAPVDSNSPTEPNHQ